SVDLHDAKTADVHGVQRAKIAEGGNREPTLLAGVEDRCALGDAGLRAIDLELHGPAAHRGELPSKMCNRFAADSTAPYAVWPTREIDAPFSTLRLSPTARSCCRFAARRRVDAIWMQTLTDNVVSENNSDMIE